MQTILDLLKEAGGYRPGLYLKIGNEHFMELVIEAVDELGLMLLLLSPLHTTPYRFDPLSDPKCSSSRFYYSNNSIGAEHCSRFVRAQPSTRNIGLLTTSERLYKIPLKVQS